MRLPRLLLISATLATAVVFSGCTFRRYEPPQATPEEQVLLAQLGRDQFSVITLIARDEDGYLVVSVQQGNTDARYVLAPAIDGATVLTIRPLDNKTRLPSHAPIRPGTGPEPRGLVPIY